MFAKIQRNDFLLAHRKLQKFLLSELCHDLCEGAKKHLYRGLMVRLAMMENAIIALDREVGKSNDPLNHYLVIELMLFLNAYYLNLAGSLDNLAWALAYQYNLINEIDEDNLKHRKLTQLVGKDFLKLLRQNNLESLYNLLEPVQKWYWDIREFRDPAAHRIPLNIPSSTVCSEDNIKRTEELDQEAALLISEEDWEKGVDLIYQSYKVGKREPVFITEAPKIKRYDLAGQINKDHGIWIEVVNNVLREGFQSKSSPST